METSNLTNKHVTIIGGGVAGLSTALDLAGFGIQVVVVEQSVFMGGHAIQYTCKATDACVKCGACLVESQLKQAARHPLIRFQPASSLEKMETGDRLTLKVIQNPLAVDPERCDNCGRCYNACAVKSIQRGSSSSQHPFFALNPETCLRNKGDDCTVCKDTCPQNAIRLDRTTAHKEIRTDALVFATGFKAYDPKNKPYGYGVFKNVMTNLELEKMLRGTGHALRISDKKEPVRMAFIQCVGSRDASQDHLWCSKVCCGSALRMARMLKNRQPGIEITVFYIDIQTFGKDFQSFYSTTREEIHFQRTIPADIFENPDHTLSITYTDDTRHESRGDIFDLVVLSVGMTPCPDAVQKVEGLGLETDSDGFFTPTCADGPPKFHGVFATGTATGPMGIAETIASAGHTANAVLSYFKAEA